MGNYLPFGAAAERYDRVRPPYPPEALRWILAHLGDRPGRVVDLGAGTGILTKALAALGHEVVPVEPDAGMRALITGAALAGSAEEIPLPDASVDAVVAGQAYHWFDRERAHPEIARVVRPGGVFGPIWNMRDEQTPWVAALTRTLAAESNAEEVSHSGWLTDPDFGGGFGPVAREIFRHSVTIDAARLVELVRSRSYYLSAPPDRQPRIDAAVRRLAATHPDLAGRDTFTLPYVTAAYRAVRHQD